ncbi:MAG: adenylosuccinate lyase [Legionellales bacterium]|jgi:adenylosuccinate lyase
MTDMTLTALSPLDGRYAKKCDALRPVLSEYALLKFRLMIEIHWLIHLSQQENMPEIKAISSADQDFLHKILEDFTVQEAQEVKKIESTTKHDVKAIEYYLKNKIKDHKNLASLMEFIHFSCTSEDINNLSYALMLKETQEKIIIPMINNLVKKLTSMAHEYASAAMLSRTHGQAASPTTMGKEIANVVARLNHQLDLISKINMFGKINGAVGNFNAHHVAYPEVDWVVVSKTFVEKLGLHFQTFTTQIEPHDQIAELLQNLIRINTILIDFSRDIWGYISLGYFSQHAIAGEVGSSTMPHKINPIDFENAEGNLGISNALASHLAEKLPISRWQRDLTDSTVLRNLGPVFGHAYLAYTAILQGLEKLALNSEKLNEDLNNNWEVLGEAIQTVMRRYGIPEPYEKLKALTRGKKLDQKMLHEFIDEQELPAEVKVQLKNLTPMNYTGYAERLVKQYINK